jgi:hypothetical protein
MFNVRKNVRGSLLASGLPPLYFTWLHDFLSAVTHQAAFFYLLLHRTPSALFWTCNSPYKPPTTTFMTLMPVSGIFFFKFWFNWSLYKESFTCALWRQDTVKAGWLRDSREWSLRLSHSHPGPSVYFWSCTCCSYLPCMGICILSCHPSGTALVAHAVPG